MVDQPVVEPLEILAALGRVEPAQATPVTGGADTALWRIDQAGASFGLRLFRPEQAAVAAREVVAMRAAAGLVPTLALVSVGEDPASKVYLRRKTEAGAEVGIEVRRVQLPAGTDTSDQKNISGSPSGSLDPRPLSRTGEPRPTFWSGPASAVGARLASVMTTVSGAPVTTPSLTMSCAM